MAKVLRAKLSLCALILDILLRCQYVQFNGSLWKTIRGLTTGNAAGTLLANIHLDPADTAVMTSSIIAPKLALYKRYVDDITTIVHHTAEDELLKLLNEQSASVQWDITASGHTSVPCLHLALSISDSGVSHELHRKQLNMYLYVPRNSCHPDSAFRSIIRSETARLMRNSSTNLRSELTLFRQKLLLRGYRGNEIYLSIDKALEQERLNSYALYSLITPFRHLNRRFFLKTLYSASVNKAAILAPYINTNS